MKLVLLVLTVILAAGQAEPPVGNYLPPSGQQNNFNPTQTDSYSSGVTSTGPSNEYGPPNVVSPNLNTNRGQPNNPSYSTTNDNLQPPPKNYQRPLNQPRVSNNAGNFASNAHGAFISSSVQTNSASSYTNANSQEPIRNKLEQSLYNAQNTQRTPSPSYGTPEFSRPAPRGFQSQQPTNNYRPGALNPRDSARPNQNNGGRQQQGSPSVTSNSNSAASVTGPSQQYGVPQNEQQTSERNAAYNQSRNQQQQQSQRQNSPNSEGSRPSQQYGLPPNQYQHSSQANKNNKNSQLSSQVSSKPSNSQPSQAYGPPLSQNQQPHQASNQGSGYQSGSERPRNNQPSQAYGLPQSATNHGSEVQPNPRQPEQSSRFDGSNSAANFQQNSLNSNQGSSVASRENQGYTSRQGSSQDDSGNYQFDYKVAGGQSGPQFSQREKSDGESAMGQYNVRLPDGRTQIVNYRADNNGFRPQIKYEGESDSTAIQQQAYSNSNQQNNGDSGQAENQGYPREQSSTPEFPIENSNEFQSENNQGQSQTSQNSFGGSPSAGYPSASTSPRTSTSQQNQPGQNGSRGYQYQAPVADSPGTTSNNPFDQYSNQSGANQAPESTFSKNPYAEYETTTTPARTSESPRQFQDETGYHYKK